jgi:hypothetical protein
MLLYWDIIAKLLSILQKSLSIRVIPSPAFHKDTNGASWVPLITPLPGWMLCQEQWRLTWLTWLVACHLSPLFLSPSSRVPRGQADEPVARSHPVSCRFRSYAVRVAFAAHACVVFSVCSCIFLRFNGKRGGKTFHVRAPEIKVRWPLNAIGESFFVASSRRVARVIVERESAYALSLPSVLSIAVRSTCDRSDFRNSKPSKNRSEI